MSLKYYLLLLLGLFWSSMYMSVSTPHQARKYSTEFLFSLTREMPFSFEATVVIPPSIIPISVGDLGAPQRGRR